MNRVLIDTVGFLALWNARDQRHDAATEAFTTLVADGTDFCTTDYIMLECGNAAARTPFRADVIQVREQFLADGKLMSADENEIERAWTAYQRGDLGDAGNVDQVSFVIMRRLGISSAFTNDRHFRAAGFTTLF
jgi:predicted nucleic acid-binding protein